MGYLSPELMTDIFTLQKNPCKISNIRLYAPSETLEQLFSCDFC